MPEDIKPVEPAAEPARKRLEKGHVRYRVLKRGHGKIHTGEEDANGPVFFNHGDESSCAREIAEGLDELGYAEIL